MKCRSKFNEEQVYDYLIVDSNKVKIHKDDFQILISKLMFDQLYEIIEKEKS